MEWMNRGGRPAQTPGHAANTAPVAQQAPHNGAKNREGKSGALKWASLALLFAGAVLILALIVLLVFGGKKDGQAKYVDNTKLQAVFLNGGQVYFGNIKNLDSKAIRLGNIYYLRVNQQVQPDGSAAANSNQDISLVKLGCELHGPQDEMVINQSQVIFWENLKDDGQVAKAVAEYKKQNPNGQQCTTTTGSTTPTTNATQQPAATQPAATTKPATTTKKN